MLKDKRFWRWLVLVVSILCLVSVLSGLLTFVAREEWNPPGFVSAVVGTFLFLGFWVLFVTTLVSGVVAVEKEKEKATKYFWE